MKTSSFPSCWMLYWIQEMPYCIEYCGAAIILACWAWCPAKSPTDFADTARLYTILTAAHTQHNIPYESK